MRKIFIFIEGLLLFVYGLLDIAFLLINYIKSLSEVVFLGMFWSWKIIQNEWHMIIAMSALYLLFIFIPIINLHITKTKLFFHLLTLIVIVINAIEFFYAYIGLGTL